jgi:ribonuclease J
MVSRSPVKLSFLGGLGEIGRNCLVIEQDAKALLIDCGLMFLNSTSSNVDYVIPNIKELFNKNLVGAIITHAHEDHMGAFSFLLEYIELDVYTSHLTAALVTRKFKDAGVLKKANLKVVLDRQVENIGPFKVEFLAAAHSVPKGFSLMIETAQGMIFHSGDFKIDLTPYDNRRTDLARIAEISNTKSVSLMLSDSTNAERPGKSESETEVGRSLLEIFRSLEGYRIFVACFASHLHRIAQVIEAASATNRKVALLGRSMIKNFEIALDEKIINVDKDFIISPEEIRDYDQKDICVICTGSQGEPLSALTSLAEDSNKFISVKKNDAVILSSQPIPGNERGVHNVLNLLALKGAKIFHSATHFVHASGHGKKDELATLISIVNPQYFIPIHGEPRHLIAHIDIAKSIDPLIEAKLCFDGAVLELAENGLKKIGKLDSSYIFFNKHKGKLETAGDIDNAAILVVIIRLKGTKLIKDPELIFRNFGNSAQIELSDLMNRLKASLNKIKKSSNVGQIEELVMKQCHTYFNKKTEFSPRIIPVILH